MRDHLERQIDCFQRMLSAVESLSEASLEDETLDATTRLQRDHAAELEVLRREFLVLMGEWQAADPGVDEQAGVRALAAKAETLSSRVSKANDEAVRLVGAHRERTKESWNELRRGRGMLKGYRLGEPPTTQRLDRKT
jgi:hypothetical protein